MVFRPQQKVAVGQSPVSDTSLILRTQMVSSFVPQQLCTRSMRSSVMCHLRTTQQICTHRYIPLGIFIRDLLGIFVGCQIEQIDRSVDLRAERGVERTGAQHISRNGKMSHVVPLQISFASDLGMASSSSSSATPFAATDPPCDPPFCGAAAAAAGTGAGAGAGGYAGGRGGGFRP